MSNFKLKIKEIRELKLISQKQLAKLAGISQSYISEVENDNFEITLDMLWKIAFALEECPLNLIECELGCKECPIRKPGN